jgi:dolichyl-diphosphooligosaccharide--protein glycosyltransferase
MYVCMYACMQVHVYSEHQICMRTHIHTYTRRFDAWCWYPLGRIIGGTIYPGLMYTASVIYWVLVSM